MVLQIGDIWPSASGTASLGVEQINGAQGGFSEEIRPFNHIHQNSGVWHDPLYGGSGILRFNTFIGGFEFSIDGGRIFHPFIALQHTYNYGHEINLEKVGAAHRGVLLKEANSSSPLRDLFHDKNNKTYDVACSGFSLTPADPTTAHLLRIGANGIAIRGSGVDLSVYDPSELFIGFLPSNNADFLPVIHASGLELSLHGPFNIDVEHNAGMLINCLGGLTAGFAGTVIMGNPGFSIDISAGIDFHIDTDEGSVNSRPNQNFLVEPFNGSGALTYRFGPHEAWAWKPSYTSVGGTANDGYFPIPHSGQITQMIKEQASLQTAYNNGVKILTTAAKGGAVAVSGNQAYAIFLATTEGDHPHMLVSGVSAIPSAGLGRGAIWVQGHTAGMMAQLQGQSEPSTYAIAAARSLGIDTIYMHHGTSGVSNVRSGSGIAQFFNGNASADIDATGIYIPMDAQTTPDTWFAVSTVSGIQTWVPGKYRITYSAVLEKSAGAAAQAATTELRLFDKLGNQFRLLGSSSAAIVNNTATLNVNSANGQWLGDLREGISLFIFCQATAAPAVGNSLRGRQRACNVIIEWIGPLSGTQSTLVKV